jgi:glycosyltransferase involved in cell wall biosynthesis
LFTYSCDFEELPTTIVSNVSDLILDSFFISSDFVIYHFGVYYELFNAILVGNGRGKQVVYYHNVTPRELSGVSRHGVAERSIRQKANISAADEIWAASEFNRKDLIQFGLDGSKIFTLPLYLKFDLKPTDGETKSVRPVQLLYVGRFVQSKGVMDLIEALGHLRDTTPIEFVLTLAGNVNFSDLEYIRSVRCRITELSLEDVVRWEGEVTDEALRALYERAHIFIMPSYHEGFCVPIAEALHFRCVPIAYASGNLPDIVGSVGVVVDQGNQHALARELRALIEQFSNGRPQKLTLQGRTRSWIDYDSAVRHQLKNFTFDAFADRVAARIATQRFISKYALELADNG